jgi:DNA-binding CsgD family transcriptional regulator
MERLSSQDVEHLVSRLREKIYAYCDVKGFKARLVSALLGPPEMTGRNAQNALSQENLGRFGLTPREAEILRLVAQGQTNKEIAAILYVSPLTIRTHLQHVYEKLGVGNRTEAVALILETIEPAGGNPG